MALLGSQGARQARVFLSPRVLSLASLSDSQELRRFHMWQSLTADATLAEGSPIPENLPEYWGSDTPGFTLATTPCSEDVGQHPAYQDLSSSESRPQAHLDKPTITLGRVGSPLGRPDHPFVH